MMISGAGFNYRCICASWLDALNFLIDHNKNKSQTIMTKVIYVQYWKIWLLCTYLAKFTKLRRVVSISWITERQVKESKQTTETKLIITTNTKHLTNERHWTSWSIFWQNNFTFNIYPGQRKQDISTSIQATWNLYKWPVHAGTCVDYGVSVGTCVD